MLSKLVLFLLFNVYLLAYDYYVCKQFSGLYFNYSDIIISSFWFFDFYSHLASVATYGDVNLYWEETELSSVTLWVLDDDDV